MIKLLKGLFSNKDNSSLEVLIKEGVYLVDVRTPQEFAEGNVKGSVNIPLDKVANQIAKFKNKENIIVFCRSGNRSAQAKMILNQNGFNNITNGGTWDAINKLIK